ncbi:MAG: hypothetical protein HN576_15485 [Bacteriovoracaceae bacterium]|nr:hypothetical protein [Bacteriovoracaceae bacterium]
MGSLSFNAIFAASKGIKMFKYLLLISSLFSTSAYTKNVDISLGKIQTIKIMVSCPSEFNDGEINAKSIIENFYVLGDQEKRRNRISGCQFNQSFPLFIENGELKMWVRWVDGSHNDPRRYEEMKRHGSVLIGTLNSNQLPTCNTTNSPWFNFVDVEANPNLKVTEIIRKRNGRHSHALKYNDGNKSAQHVGWVTQNARSSRRAERYCYLK